MFGGEGLEGSGDGEDGFGGGSLEGVFFGGDGFEADSVLFAPPVVDSGFDGGECVERADECGRGGAGGGVFGPCADGAVEHVVEGFVVRGHC